jgi:hypothetical protein
MGSWASASSVSIRALSAGILPPLPLQGKHLLVPLTQCRVTEGEIGEERMPWFLLRQVLPGWFRHCTLLLLVAKNV